MVAGPCAVLSFTGTAAYLSTVQVTATEQWLGMDCLLTASLGTLVAGAAGFGGGVLGVRAWWHWRNANMQQWLTKVRPECSRPRFISCMQRHSLYCDFIRKHSSPHGKHTSKVAPDMYGEKVRSKEGLRNWLLQQRHFEHKSNLSAYAEPTKSAPRPTPSLSPKPA